MRRFLAVAPALGLLAPSVAALEAIDARPIDAPSAWSTAGVLRRTEPLGAGDAAVALWSSYRAVPTTSDAATRTMWLGELTAAYGVSPRVTVALAAPVLLRGYGIYGAPLSALGDARLVVAHTVVVPGVVGAGLSWAIGLRAPTGDRASGVAYAAPAGTLSVHGEYRFALAEGLAHLGASHVLARGASQSGVVHEAPTTLLEYGVGISVRTRDILRFGGDRPRLELAGTGRTAVGGPPILDGWRAHLSERFFLDADDDVSLVVGLGIALSGADEAFGTVGLRFSPRTHDRDGDGVADRVDECPELEEDLDGFEDSDGCPEVDNDNDDVADDDDKCPNAPGPGEYDGCPARPSREEAPPPSPLPRP